MVVKIVKACEVAEPKIEVVQETCMSTYMAELQARIQAYIERGIDVQNRFMQIQEACARDINALYQLKVRRILCKTANVSTKVTNIPWPKIPVPQISFPKCKLQTTASGRVDVIGELTVFLRNFRW